VRARDIRVGARYALRRSGYLPNPVTVTWFERGRVDYDDRDGQPGRAKLSDILGPWEPHAAALARADAAVEALRGRPAGRAWYEAVYPAYAGDRVAVATAADFGVNLQLTCDQAEWFAC
jgi:hypothetical protein